MDSCLGGLQFPCTYNFARPEVSQLSRVSGSAPAVCIDATVVLVFDLLMF